MNLVEIEFKTLQKLCKRVVGFITCSPEIVMRKCDYTWEDCDPFNCPYCEMKDEDDLK